MIEYYIGCKYIFLFNKDSHSYPAYFVIKKVDLSKQNVESIMLILDTDDAIKKAKALFKYNVKISQVENLIDKHMALGEYIDIQLDDIRKSKKFYRIIPSMRNFNTYIN